METIPDFLTELLIKQYGKEITNKILQGYAAHRDITFRVNPLKTNIQLIEEQLSKQNIIFEHVSWYKDAFVIKNVQKKQIQELEIYQSGKIYLQNLSSMLPPIALEPKIGENILDMTAAPGGKTTQIASLTGNKAFITACEKKPIRAERLKYNLEKQGVTCTFVMVKDARNLDDYFSFDKILLDAPCSGSGTLCSFETNKNFTQNLIQKSINTQFALLKKALKLLKPGKEMVYSTCSILECENEKIIKKVIEEENAQIVPIQIKGLNEISLLPVSIKGTICVCPTQQYEGFFMAKIKK